jgi:hypothetical protein
MFSPAAAAAMPFCRALRKRGSSLMTWSDVGVVALDEEGGKAASRRGVAGHRLLHDLRGGHAGQLVGNLMGQKLVSDDPGFFQRCERFEPFHGLLNHGALAVESENLLGASAPGTGPETGTAAPGQNHGTEIDGVRH